MRFNLILFFYVFVNFVDVTARICEETRMHYIDKCELAEFWKALATVAFEEIPPHSVLSNRGHT